MDVRKRSTYQTPHRESMEAIFEALKEGDETAVTRLLDEEPELLEMADDVGNLPLTVAARHGQLGAVKLLIQRGANTNGTWRCSTTALHEAAHQGHEEVVTFLLSNGAQANSRDVVRRTPLMVAFQRGHAGVVQLLVQHMETQRLEDKDNEGRTVLHLAAMRGDQDCVDFLLRHGASRMPRDKDGMLPIMLACAENHLGKCDCLPSMERGCRWWMTGSGRPCTWRRTRVMRRWYAACSARGQGRPPGIKRGGHPLFWPARGDTLVWSS